MHKYSISNDHCPVTPGYTWSTALLVACTSLTTIPLMLVKETHNRRADDEPTAGNNDKDNHGQ